jgi:MFS transporter, FHS family, glucose/mannose:H+ symporter
MSNSARDPHRLGVAITANACMFIFGVVLLLMGSLLPSLEVNYAQAGSLGSFPLAGIWLATALAGPFLDLIGAKPALVVALIITAVPLAVISFVQRVEVLAVAAFVYGLGGGLLNTATNVLIAELQTAGRAAALNLLGFSFSLGALASPLLMSSLGGMSPAMVVRLLAIVTAMVLIPVLLLRFPPARRAGTPLRVLLQVLRRPLVWVFGVLLLFESGSENCMFVWSGKIVGDTLRVTAPQASGALVGLTAAMGLGRLSAAAMLRRLSGRTMLMISAVLAACGAALVGTSSTFAGMLAGMVVVGLGMSAIYPTALGLAADAFSGETGTVLGAIITVSLAGGVAGPKLGGVLAARAPLAVLWIPGIAALAIFLSTFLLGAKSKPQSESQK